MKNIIYIITLLSLFSVLMIAQPKASFSETSFDFGNINQGEVVTHEFVLKNEGTNPLKIDKVKASCGCTAAAPDVEELQPGETAKIKVSFDSHGRKGVQKKYVYVFTNDPESPQSRLAFTTNIVVGAEPVKEKQIPNLALGKREIDFGQIKEGEIKSAQISFMNKGKANLVITDIKTACECTIVSVSTKNLSPNEVAFLNVQFDSKGRNGEVTRTITLFTNDKNNPEESIIVRANIIKENQS